MPGIQKQNGNWNPGTPTAVGLYTLLGSRSSWSLNAFLRSRKSLATSFQRVWNALRLRLSNLMIVECEPYEFLKEGAAELVAMLVEATCIFIRLVLTTLWPIPKLIRSSRIWLLLGFLKLCEFPTLLNWSQLLVCDLLITNCTITESLQHDAWCIFSDCTYLFRERSYKLTRMQNGDPTSFLLRLLVRNEPTRKDKMCKWRNSSANLSIAFQAAKAHVDAKHVEALRALRHWVEFGRIQGSGYRISRKCNSFSELIPHHWRWLELFGDPKLRSE